MKLRATEPGLYISAALHGALLLAALVSFSETRKFSDAAEAIPVDMITESQFNEVVKGVRSAPAVETPKPVVDRVADVEESKPQPVIREAKVDIAAPPPPAREPDPTPPEPPAPPQAAAPPEPPPPIPTPPRRPPEPPRAEPQPPKPEPPKPEPAKPEPPKPEPPRPQAAEAIDPPRPPPRPRDLPKVAMAKPEPPKPEPPKPAAAKPQLDRTQIAALLEKQKKEEEARKKPAPPSGREQTDQRRFDPNSIAKLLSREEPGQRASTGRAVNQTASIGNPNATGQRMSPSLWGQLDGYMIDQYKRCWNYISLGPAARYVPQIEVSFTQTGGLRGEPRLRNQPSDPNLRALADSAMRAVKQCNPLRIPERFLPYYNEWKDRILRFDPDEMAG